MDALFEVLRNVSVQILPILGAAVLIFLLVIMKKVFDILKQASKTMERLDKTLDVVDDAIVDVSASLRTVRSITNGIDAASALATHSIASLAKIVVENYDVIKTWFLDLFNKKKNRSIITPEEGE